ncbi:MAG TPA: DUF4124 domain-containing protein [Gammaproteobacteria bacterium]|nr:DUF4124 domain-containing protein [Gammaproteobacteria bacterium]
MKPRCKLAARALFLCCGLAASAAVFAAAPGGDTTVYTWVDSQGVRHYSDQPDGDGAKAISVAAPAPISAPAVVAAPPRSSKKPASASASTPSRPPPSATLGSARCAQLRMQVEALEPARRAVVTLNGKTRHLSGEDLARFKDALRARMQSACAAADSSG